MSIKHFLDRLELPALSDDNKETLEDTITKKEVTEARNLFASEKSSGHEGFHIEFFKAFHPTLIDPMFTMFDYAIEMGSTLSHWSRCNLLFYLSQARILNFVVHSYLFQYFEVNIFFSKNPSSMT